jgi:hypothetical protein
MTKDQKELIEIMDSETWEAVAAMSTQLASRFADRVLKCSPMSEELSLAKAKYDGAQELIGAMNARKRELTKEGKKNA